MSRRLSVTVVGDVVWDRDLGGRVDRVCPDAPVPVLDVESDDGGPGAAGLAALVARADGADVTLVAPMTDDEAGRQLSEALGDAGVATAALRQHGDTRVKTRVRAGDHSLMRLDRGGPATPAGELTPEAAAAIQRADVVLVSCYGAGTAEHEGVRAALAARAPLRPVVWDPHPKGGTPVPGCALVTPNLDEARGFAGMPGGPVEEVARRLLGAWGARAVAVTVGADGAWLSTSSSEPLYVPAVAVRGDVCGAGDRFAVSAALALAHGRTASEAVTSAVADATSFVAAGGASGFRELMAGVSGGGGSHGGPANRGAGGEGGLVGGGSVGGGSVGGGSVVGGSVVGGSVRDGSAGTVAELVARVRARGGTVVATGGCFDVLHAGHVESLSGARRLGDVLVVLLNSDASARRLKGPGRPVNGVGDRAKVLLGLSSVDAVLVFDEDDPAAMLGRLRPDIWAKGADYEGAELAEAELVRSWGGRVVLLPYLSGRSTTAILDEVRTEADHAR